MICDGAPLLLATGLIIGLGIGLIIGFLLGRTSRL